MGTFVKKSGSTYLDPLSIETHVTHLIRPKLVRGETTLFSVFSATGFIHALHLDTFSDQINWESTYTSVG